MLVVATENVFGSNHLYGVRHEVLFVAFPHHDVFGKWLGSLNREHAILALKQVAIMGLSLFSVAKQCAFGSDFFLRLTGHLYWSSSCCKEHALSSGLEVGLSVVHPGGLGRTKTTAAAAQREV